MSKISSPAASVAIAASVVLAEIGGGLLIDNARADNCAAAPNAAAPPGQHWYYRIERLKHRKCWYLHATVRSQRRSAPPLESRAASPASTGTQAGPEPAIAATPPDAASAALAESAPPEPQITILNVKPIATPFVGAVTEDDTRQAAPPPESNAVTTAGNAGRSAGADEVTSGAASAVEHSEPAQTAAAAPATARPKPAEMLLLLAIGLSLVAFLIGIAGKIIAARRQPIISDDRDAAWGSYWFGRQRAYPDAAYDTGDRYEEQDIAFVDPREPHRIADPHEQECIDRSPSAPRAVADRSAQGLHASSAEPSGSGGLEPALRVLRQARQHRVA